MKVINIMNFVRQCDPRLEDSEKILFDTTRQQVALVKQYAVENTFLLQYDALIDPRYQELFLTERDERMELGLWYEIVKPLCDKAGIAWRGREDWTWDWHVVPGFSMAYTKEERKRLIDIAMEDFRQIYGEYPRTVASWLLDSYTVSYLAEHYPVTAFGICRDQTNTDAYTLVGGYFNQAYYPSKNNMFTPAQTKECQVSVPIFRLLGPDPIHNYDNDRYLTNPKYLPYQGCYTLEPVWRSGASPEVVDWFFDSYFAKEDLEFSYAQLGQENSFGPELLPGLSMQLEKLKDHPELSVWKMGDTGAWFQKQYPEETPATCVMALNDWDGSRQVQSVYYDCKHYMANLFRCGRRVFFRCLYLFDETRKEAYLDQPCTTWDACYDNLPVVDTLLWKGSTGLTLDFDGGELTARKGGAADALEVLWDDSSVVFSEDAIYIRGVSRMQFDYSGSNVEVEIKCAERDSAFADAEVECATPDGNFSGAEICFRSGDSSYALEITGAKLTEKNSGCILTTTADEVVFRLRRAGRE